MAGLYKRIHLLGKIKMAFKNMIYRKRRYNKHRTIRENIIKLWKNGNSEKEIAEYLNFSIAVIEFVIELELEKIKREQR
jgi:DNA-binding NarL/FixJ family response regulator